eukprot:3944729-Pyramimonas_sp.AAC.1
MKSTFSVSCCLFLLPPPPLSSTGPLVIRRQAMGQKQCSATAPCCTMLWNDMIHHAMLSSAMSRCSMQCNNM